MAPTVGTATTASHSANQGSITVDAPTLADGTLLLFITENYGARTISSSIATKIVETLSTNGIARLVAWWRWVENAAGEPSTYGFTYSSTFTEHGGAICLPIAGAANPADIAIVFADDKSLAGHTSPAVAPSITPTVEDSLVISIAGNGRSAGDLTPPGSETEIATITDGACNLSATHFTHGVSATGTVNFGQAGFAEWCTQRLSVAPAITAAVRRRHLALLGVGA